MFLFFFCNAVVVSTSLLSPLPFSTSCGDVCSPLSLIPDQLWRKSVQKGQPGSKKPWNCKEFFAEIDFEEGEYEAAEVGREVSATSDEESYLDCDTGVMVHYHEGNSAQGKT